MSAIIGAAHRGIQEEWELGSGANIPHIPHPCRDDMV